MVVGGQSVPRNFFAEFLVGNPPIFDGDLLLFALRLSLAYSPSNSLPMITVRIFLKAPFLELSYVLCLAGIVVKAKAPHCTRVTVTKLGRNP